MAEAASVPEQVLSREEEVAEQSHQRAESALLELNYGKAFSHYLLVMRLVPGKKYEIKNNFTLSLREWGEQLAKANKIKDLFSCYKQACEVFPECDTMLNDMGSQLFRLGYIDEAACCFRRAVKLDPDFLPARENLENMCGHLVERWHFRMLNDRRRNESFQSAIHRAIRNGYDEMLDIGTGTGLLSLFGVEGGAKKVFGCEMSKTMYEMSCDVVATNQMTEKINLIHKKSTELRIPTDLPNRVSLIVTETFDAGLLGEHVLPTLQHAWKHLLKENRRQARVIPESAKVYACAIQCESIRNQNRLLYPGVQYLDLSDVDITCTTSLSHLDSYEPYTTERLDSIKGGCKFLSDPIPVMHFNFNNLQSIDHYIKGFSQDVEMLITVNGRLDGIATWFDLNLDQEHTLSSAPGMQSCWEQAVYPVLPQHLLEKDVNENFLVRHGDLLNVTSECRENILHFRCNRIARSSQVTARCESSSSHLNVIPVTMTDLQLQCQPFSLYTHHYPPHHREGSLPPSSSPPLPSFHPNSHPSLSPMEFSHSYDLDFPPLLKPKCSSSSGMGGSSPAFVGTGDHSAKKSGGSHGQSKSFSTNSKMTCFLERSEIGKLNDLDYNRMLCKGLEQIKSQLESAHDFTVIDLSGGISTLPLQAVKLGAKEVCILQNNTTNQELLCYLTASNSIDPNRVSFSSTETVEGCEAEWGIAVVSDIVEACGCLRQQVLEDLALARITCLQPNGVILPNSVTVFGMVIESEVLHKDSAVVSDESMCGFLIAAFMNDFQMTTHQDVDLSTLEYKKLSEPFELFKFNFNSTPSSEMPSFLDINKTMRVKAIESGQVTAVVYWFDIELAESVNVCTLNHNMHWKQAAVMQRVHVTVSTDGEMCVKAVCKNSCIGVSVFLP